MHLTEETPLHVLVYFTSTSSIKLIYQGTLWSFIKHMGMKILLGNLTPYAVHECSHVVDSLQDT